MGQASRLALRTSWRKPTAYCGGRCVVGAAGACAGPIIPPRIIPGPI